MAAEKAAVEQAITSLEPYEDAVLLAGIKEVLEQRPSVVQELCDWAVPDYAYANSRMLTESRLSGVIKTFSDNNGYGFIECPEVKAAFGSDVFLHWRQLNGHSIGDQVTFTILVNKERKPQAFDLGSVHGSDRWAAKGAGKAGAALGGWSAPGKEWKGKSVWSGKGTGREWKEPETSIEMEGVTDQRFNGVIKSFNEGKGFGFIACEEMMTQFGSDVFLHHFQLGEFKVGSEVSFGVILNKEGKPQAKELQALASNDAVAEPALKKGRWA